MTLLLVAGIVLLGAVSVLAQVTEVWVDDDYTAATSGWGVTHFEKIQDGVNGVADNGTVHVAAGTYTPTSTIVVNKNNLVIEGPQADVDPRPSYGSTRTAGSAQEAVIDGNIHSLGMIIEIDAENVVINGLEVKSGTGDMIKQNNTHSGAAVKYCMIHDGLGDEGVQLKKATNAVLEYNYVFEIANAGDGLNIADGSSYCSIRYNEVAGIHGENAAIYIYGSEHMEIIGNLVRDSGGGGNDGIKVGTKGGGDASRMDVWVKDNIIHDIIQDGISVYMSGVTVEGNEVYNCTSENGAIYIAWSVHDVTVRYNAVYNNTLDIRKWGTPGGITIGEDVSAGSVQIYGNTLAGNSPADVANLATGAPLLDATANWWGQDSGPLAGHVAGNVAYSPWLGNDPSQAHWTFIVDDVGPEPPAGYIQTALDYAIARDNVHVLAGTYCENLVMNTSRVNLWTNPGAVIDGGGSGTAVSVTADRVTINGFEIMNGNMDGVALDGSNRSVIKKNEIHDNVDDGVSLVNSDRNKINRNEIYNNAAGIYLEEADNNTLRRNDIYNNTYGIQLFDSNRNLIKKNNLYDNGVGIFLLKDCDLNRIINNEVYNNWAGIWINGYWGVPQVAYPCNLNEILHNEVYGNDYGIGLAAAFGTTVNGNTIHNNAVDGLVLDTSDASTIQANEIYDNDGRGVYLYLSNANSLIGNTIYGNATGIQMEDSSGNSISGNTVYGNLNVPDYAGVGILLWGDNDNNDIIGNVIFDNDRQGIFIGYDDASKISTGNLIAGNIIHDNGLYTNPNAPDPSAYGIQFWCADGNLIEENEIYNHNTWWFAQGIYLYDSCDNVILGNYIHDNSYGINQWGASVGNKVHGNSIENNSQGIWNVDGDPSCVIDAALNWWGDVNGPAHADNPAGTGNAVSGNVIYSPWLGIGTDAEPGTVGWQPVSPMLIIVDDVGPVPPAEIVLGQVVNTMPGYLNRAIGAANLYLGTDTIEVRHGTYDASEPITEGVNIFSEPGSAAHTTLDGNMTLGSSYVVLGRRGQGFTVLGTITVPAGTDVSTIRANWNNLLGALTNKGTGAVDATLNYWGDPNGPSAGDAVGAVAYSPWLSLPADDSPMLFIVDDVGPAPTAGYLNTAIAASNDLPGSDTIEVRHGTYDASEPITEAVNIVSETGSAAHTTLNGDMTLGSSYVVLGRRGQGFTVLGTITVPAGTDASTIRANWNNLLGALTNKGTGAVDATLNYWGDPNGPSAGDAVGAVAYSPWLGLAADDSPMLFVVAPVGSEPAGGYLNTAIAAANDLPGTTDTIEVRHGTYDGSEPITEAVNIISQPGSALHTTLNGNMSINGNGVLVGLPLQGFRVNGNVTVGAGNDAGTSSINWCDLYGNMTNNGTGTFDAQYNYWGTLLASVVDARTTGLIDYDPFLPKNADDSYVDATAIMAAGLAAGIDPAIDQLWLMVQLGQDVNTFIQYQGVAGAGAFAGAPAGAEIIFGGAAGGGGAVEGVISGTYAVGDPIEGRFTLTDPVTGEPITDAAVTTSLLGPDGSLVSWGCATYDETTGEYIFTIDTSGLAPGTYELIIQTDDGQSKTVSIEVQAA